MKDLKGAITEKGLKNLLGKVVAEGYSSRGDWARSHDITPQSVSAFMTKSQGAGLQIPEALGYKPMVIYVPVRQNSKKKRRS